MKLKNKDFAGLSKMINIMENPYGKTNKHFGNVAKEMYSMAKENIDIYNKLIKDMWDILTDKEGFDVEENDLVKLKNCYIGMRKSKTLIGSPKDLLHGSKGAASIEMMLNLSEQSEKIISEIIEKEENKTIKSEEDRAYIRIENNVKFLSDIFLENFRRESISTQIRRGLSSAFNTGKIILNELKSINADTFDRMNKIVYSIVDLAANELVKHNQMRVEEKIWILDFISTFMKNLKNFNPDVDGKPPKSKSKSHISAKKGKEEKEEKENPQFTRAYNQQSIHIHRLVMGFVTLMTVVAFLSGFGIIIAAYFGGKQEKKTRQKAIPSISVTRKIVGTLEDIRQSVVNLLIAEKPHEKSVVTKLGDMNIPNFQLKVKAEITDASEKKTEITFDANMDIKQFNKRAETEEEKKLFENFIISAKNDVDHNESLKLFKVLNENMKDPDSNFSKLSESIAHGMHQLADLFSLENILYKRFEMYWNDVGFHDNESSSLVTTSDPEIRAKKTTTNLPVQDAFRELLNNTLYEGKKNLFENQNQVRELAENSLMNLRDRQYVNRANVSRWLDDFSFSFYDNNQGFLNWIDTRKQHYLKEYEDIKTLWKKEVDISNVIKNTALPFAELFVDSMETSIENIETKINNFNEQSIRQAQNQDLDNIVTNILLGNDSSRYNQENKAVVTKFIQDGGEWPECQKRLYYNIDNTSGIGIVRHTWMRTLIQWFSRGGTFSGEFIWFLIGGRSITSIINATSLAYTSIMAPFTGIPDVMTALWIIYEGVMVAFDAYVVMRQTLTLLRMYALIHKGVGAYIESKLPTIQQSIESLRKKGFLGNKSLQKIPLIKILGEHITHLGVSTNKIADKLESFAIAKLKDINEWEWPGYVIAATMFGLANYTLKFAYTLFNHAITVIPDMGPFATPTISAVVIISTTYMFGAGVLPRVINKRQLIEMEPRIKDEVMGFFHLVGGFANIVSMLPYYGFDIAFKYWRPKFRKKIIKQIESNEITAWYILLFQIFGSFVNILWMEALTTELIPFLIRKTQLPNVSDDIINLGQKRDIDGVFPEDWSSRKVRMAELSNQYLIPKQMDKCNTLIESAKKSEVEKFNENIKIWSSQEKPWKTFQYYSSLVPGWREKLNSIQKTMDDGDLPTDMRLSTLKMMEELPALFDKMRMNILLSSEKS